MAPMREFDDSAFKRRFDPKRTVEDLLRGFAERGERDAPTRGASALTPRGASPYSAPFSARRPNVFARPTRRPGP